MSVLTVYKASAGSGKTFRLTREYLKLLFESAFNYKRILAVTFTNKAAGEMKSRILSQLNSLAKSNEILLNQISKETGLPPLEIKQKAEFALKILLHDYSRFSIGTIDSFFQKVIRSFAKEIGLPLGFAVELDNTKILEEVTDRLLISIENNELLKSWLVQFSENKIEEGKAWDFKKDMLVLAKEIFKEGYALFDKDLIEKMSDKDFLNFYLKDLLQLKIKFETYLKNIGDKALQIIKDNYLEIEDFSYKHAGVAGYFQKLSEKRDFEPGKRILDALDNPERWYSKTSNKKADIQTAIESGLNKLLNEAITYYSSEKKLYNTANVVQHFIFTLGILTDISKQVRQYSEEKNIFLLSDSSKLLHQIISDNNTPFVYEKTGNMFKFFMIDEFQDTSVLQWENFRPLIQNSLSEGNSNFLVGDVKQSIYRWRNSDWNILAEQIEDEFPGQQSQKKDLKLNWRSKRNIVDFNNACFYNASHILQNIFNNELEQNKIEDLSFLKEKISNAYSDYYQELPAKKTNEGGFVRIELVNDNEKNKWKNQVKLKLPLLLQSLQDRGYRLKDIAILVRNKNEGKEIADLLIECKNNNQISDTYRFDFISNEALFIKSSSSVQLLLAIFRYFADQENRINKAFIVHEYLRYLKQEGFDEALITDFFEQGEETNEEWFEKHLPKEFIENISLLKQLPLLEMTEYLIIYFSLHTNKYELPYLQAFMEVVLEYSRKYTVDILSFLDWWGETGENKTISVSSQQDAIQILTIHKSKGLEFEAVIIPFCNWQFEQSGVSNVIWCKPDKPPFNHLDVIPVRYSSKLSETYFYKEYYNEKLQYFVDNMNLMYVAFTRAESELYVFSKQISNLGNTKLKNASDLLFSILQSQEKKVNKDLIGLPDFWDNENNILQIGYTQQNTSKDKSFQKERFEMKSYSISPFSEKLKLNLHGKDYFAFEENKRTAHLNRGKMMHEMFSKIETVDHLEFAIKEQILLGKLTEAEGKELKFEMKSILAEEKVRDWFSGDWEVKNETEILLGSGKTKRPDKVLIKGEKAIVVDYKFGETERSSSDNNRDKEQVRGYTEYLKEMGYKEVEGYVWYVDLRKVVSIQ